MTERASQALREATRAAHDRMERTPPMRRLFAHDYRLDEFVDLLARMHSVYAPLDAVFADAGPARAIGYRPRAPLLTAALSGNSLKPATIPPLVDETALWGALYVVEGSIMGGQVISRHLAARFGALDATVAAFFRPYGDDAGGQWQRFRTALDGALYTSDRSASAAAAAGATFAVFHEAFEIP